MINPFGTVETRWATLLIGIQEALWASAPLIDQGHLAKALGRHGDDWFFVMFFCGVMLIVGSIFPCRSLRHIALFLSSVVWMVTFGLLIKQQATLSAPMLTIPAMGIFCLLLLFNDAAKKGDGNGSY